MKRQIGVLEIPFRWYHPLYLGELDWAQGNSIGGRRVARGGFSPSTWGQLPPGVRDSFTAPNSLSQEYRSSLVQILINPLNASVDRGVPTLPPRNTRLVGAHTMGSVASTASLASAEFAGRLAEAIASFTAFEVPFNASSMIHQLNVKPGAELSALIGTFQRSDNLDHLNGNNTFVLSAATARVALAAAVRELEAAWLRGLEVEVPSGDPQVTQAGGSWVATKVVDMKRTKPLVHEGVMRFYVSKDTVSFTVSLHSALSAAVDDRLGPAVTAMETYNRDLAKAIATKADGGVPVWPTSIRPPATVSQDLPEGASGMLDAWWSSVQAALVAAKSATGPTAATAYQNYVSAGGTLSEVGWAAAREGRVTAATAQAGTSNSWVTGLGSALGWAGDKAASALQWAGDNTVGMLKSWGPLGTAGAYTTIRAANAVSSQNPWLLGGLALGVLLILK